MPESWWQLNDSAVGNEAVDQGSGSSWEGGTVHGLMPVAASFDLSGLPLLNMMF